MIKKSDFFLMPKDELTSPCEGSVVFLDRWWIVTENNEVMFYTKLGAFSPQCNRDKNVAEYMLRHYPGMMVEHIPVAYVPAKAVYQS